MYSRASSRSGGSITSLAALAILQAGATVQAVSLPAPSGPYSVGFTKQDIEHLNSDDPLAPNNVSTAFLATIYYPTPKTPGCPSAKPYLDPELAAIMAEQWNYTTETLASMTADLREDAPFLDGPTGQSPYPTILFGPGGGGPPVAGNTIIISELVSHGYTVVGLDHPFEQPFMRFANGTGVLGVDIDYTNLELVEAFYGTRLVDTLAFLDYFPELVQRLEAPINTITIGGFGYSIGGAAAVEALYGDDRVTSGLNLDGQFFGVPAINGSEADAKSPVFMLGNEGHAGGPGQADITWSDFPLWQTGYLRKMLVDGTTHHDFCDDTFWKTVEPTDPSTGPIDGNRMVEVTNALVKAFFDYTLLGQNSPILDGPSEDWPEIIYFDV